MNDNNPDSNAAAAAPPVLQAMGCGATDAGRERDRNEDIFLVDDELGLYVVCDGMGGHAAGEVAAATAVRVAHELVAAHQPAVARFMEGRPDAELISALATQAIQAASQEIYRLATTQAKHAGMGSTMTMLLVGGHQAVMAHVGDTRLYLSRSGVCHRLTTDHTMAEDLVRSGALTAEQAKDSRWVHVLSRSVGNQSSVQVDTLVFDVLPGDRLLLCSDGLSNYLTDASVLAGLLEGELEDLPDKLIAWANARGGSDNITAVVVGLIPDDPPALGALPLDAHSQAHLETLQAAPLFASLTVPQLLRILHVGHLVTVPTETPVYAAGQHFDAAVVVLKGRLRVVRDAMTVALCGPGDCVGCGLAFQPRETHASLVADEDSTLLLIHHAGLQALQQRRPRLANLLLSRLGHQLSVAVSSLHGSQQPLQFDGAPPLESPPSDYI